MSAPGAAADLGGIDPVTFEVIRHRLWSINDDQATTAGRLSGSPVVYEAFDFNAALLTPDGRNLFSGTYIVSHASTLDFFVQRVIEEWPAEEIRPGDMFFTNDPWWGALHANDGVLACPFFYDGEIVAWGAIVMHDQDVGSPVPGSFVVGAADRFGEAPLVPGVKLVERYEPRADIARMFFRNHRTPELNALNLRARVAALKMTQGRLTELIERYGPEVFAAAREAIIDHVEQMVRKKLRQIPDGSWSERLYLDHDGLTPARYPIECTLRKSGDSLTVDFTGTAPQAAGAINCTRPALEGATFGVVLTCLCYDVPWCVGALRRIVEIVSDPGTVNDATGDAAVSMASIMATLSTQNAVANAFGKMLAASEALAGEAQAAWAPGHNIAVYAGIDERGETFAGPVLDALGAGGGARSYGDGIDSAGDFGAMSASIPNAETTESRYPLLVLYRRERADSCGHGRFRGGVGIEFAVKPHRNPVPVTQVAIASGVEQPAGNGIGGGCGPAVHYNLMLRGSNAGSLLGSGRVPGEFADLTADLEILQAKDRTEFDGDDVHVCGIAGGGAVGDPLRREPERVLADLADGLISAGVAERVYGVVIDGGELDLAAAESRREAIRRERLSESAPVGSPSTLSAATGDVLQAISDSLELAEIDGERSVCCSQCHRRLAAAGRDPRQGCLARDVGLEHYSPLNAFAPRGESFFREYSCPGCGGVVETQLVLAEEGR
jgi:N-methylhydantoinase B